MFIRQLEYLVALAREKHFARAAELCCVSQPTLSAGIRSLEQELGLSLVQRGQHRYIGLTSDGERIFEWAKQTIAAWEGLRQEASSARDHLDGTLRLGAIPTTVPIVPFLTGPVRAAYPDIHQLVRSLSSEEIIRSLDNHDLDLGLTYLADEGLPGFWVRPLYRERYVLLAGDAAAVAHRTEMSWAEASTLPLCLLTENMQNRRIINAAFRRAKVQPHVAVETDSVLALYSHVLGANMFSIVPHSVLSLMDRSRRVVTVRLVPELTRSIGLIAVKQDPWPPIVAAALHITELLDLDSVFASIIGGDYQLIEPNI